MKKTLLIGAFIFFVSALAFAWTEGNGAPADSASEKAKEEAPAPQLSEPLKANPESSSVVPTRQPVSIPNPVPPVAPQPVPVPPVATPIVVTPQAAPAVPVPQPVVPASVVVSEPVAQKAAEPPAQTTETATPALPAAKTETEASAEKKEEAKTESKSEPAAVTPQSESPKKAESSKKEDILLIDDFNGGVRSNLLGGAIGSWSKDEYDDTQSCDIDFVEHPRLGKSGGYSMKITYDVDSPNPAYNGVWMKLDGLNATPYKYLVLYVKAPNSPPYGTDKMKIELRNSKKETGAYVISRIPRGAWREYKIPLNQFKGIKDLSSLEEIVFVFEDKVSNPKEGILFVENIYLTKGETRRPQ